jgi:hypothetical protein
VVFKPLVSGTRLPANIVLAYPLLRLALFAAASGASSDTVGKGSGGGGGGGAGIGFGFFGFANNPPIISP